MAPTAGQARLVRSVFIALVPCLLAQLWLRRITEPYPSVLLPAGASLLRSDGGGYIGTEMTLFVEDAQGQQHFFPASALLDTVPTDYRRNMIRRGFGMIEGRDVRSVRIRFGHGHGAFVLRFGNPLTQADIEQTREWLRNKVRRSLGIDATRIHILTYSLGTFGSRRGEGEERTLKQSNTVELVGPSR